MSLATRLSFFYGLNAGNLLVDLLGNAPTLTNVGSIGTTTGLAKVRGAATTAGAFVADTSKYLWAANDALFQISNRKCEYFFWVKWTSGASPVLINQGVSGSATFDWLIQGRSTDPAKWSVQVHNGTSGTQLDSSETATSATVFLRFRHDQTAKKIYLSVNNGAFTEATYTGTIRESVGARVEIGRFVNASNALGGALQGWGGILDDWLTDAEARYLYYNGAGAMADDNGNFGDTEHYPLAFDGLGGTTGDNPNPVSLRVQAASSITISGTTWQQVNWYNSSNKMVIAKRSHSGDYNWSAWTQYVLDGNGGRPDVAYGAGAADDHETCGAELDRNGRLIIAYNHHNSPLHMRVSDAAIDTWTGGFSAEFDSSKFPVGTPIDDVTYTALWRSPVGDLYFMFRDGSSGNGDTYLLLLDPDNLVYLAAPGTTATGKMVDGITDTVNFYPENEPKFSPDWDGEGAGFMHITGMWRTTPPALNADISHFRWNSSAFTKINGSAQTIPVRKGNANIVWANANQTTISFLNQCDGDVDGSGRPHWPVLAEDADGKMELYHVYLNAGSLVSLKLTDYNSDDYLDWGRPNLVFDRLSNIARIYFTNLNDTNVVLVYTSDPGDFTTWTKSTAWNWALGRYEPRYDRTQWLTRREIHLLATPRDVTGDQPVQFVTLAYAAPAPTVTSITPDEAQQGGTGDFTVAGTGFVDGAAATFSGTGITVNSTTWVSSTELTVNITVAGDATLSARDLTVTNPDEQDDTLEGALTIVAAVATIARSPASLDFTATVDGSNPANQTFTIDNTGDAGSALNVTISDDAAWLSVTPTSAAIDEDEAANTFTVSVDVTGLAAGTYTATVTITDGDASNSPQTVAVELVVSEAAGEGVVFTRRVYSDKVYRGNVFSEQVFGPEISD